MAKLLTLFFTVLISAVAPIAYSAQNEAPVIRVDGVLTTTSPVNRIAEATISLTTSFPNGSIFYTLDGSAPSPTSTRYTNPFTISETRILRAISYSIDFSQFAPSDSVEIRIEIPVNLTLLNSFPNAGSVSVMPLPTNGKYFSNQIVQIQANATDGWRFLEWHGDLVSKDNPSPLQLNGNKIVRVTFGTTVNILPPANGKIVSDKNPLHAAAGDTLRLTAIPNHGYYFATWGGAGTGSTQHYAFRVLQPNVTISALFLPLPEPTSNKVTLSVYTQDGEGGRVQITHRDNSDAALPFYTSPDGRLLQAIPNPGWAFTGWTGDIVTKDNPAAIRLDSPKVVVGHFAQGYSLVVEKQDGGAVSVSPNQPAYSSNSLVQLQAEPEAGFTFGGWRTSAGLQMENPLSLTITSNTVLNAYFNAPERVPIWSFPTTNRISRIAADFDGNAFILSSDKLMKLSQDGNLLWSISFTNRPKYVSNYDLLIDHSGNARVTFFGGGNEFQLFYGGIALVEPDGTATFHSIFPAPDNISLASDGTLYSTSVSYRYHQGFYQPSYQFDAFSSLESRKWTISESYTNPNDDLSLYYNQFSRAAIGLDNRIYLSSNGDWNATNAMYCVNASGHLLWKFPRLLKSNVRNTPILGVNRVYTTDEFGWILALNRDGVREWRFHTTEQLRLPSIGAEGVIYFGGIDSSRFYSVNPDRSVNWVKNPGRGSYSIPAIGSDGSIYVSDGHAIHALASDGNRLWMNTTSDLAAPIIVGNTLYTFASDRLLAFHANAFGPANSPWPMFEAGPNANSQEKEAITPPEFDVGLMTIGDDGFRVAVTGHPGSTARIYYSTDLQSWILIHTEILASGILTFLHQPAPTNSANFYRVATQ